MEETRTATCCPAKAAILDFGGVLAEEGFHAALEKLAQDYGKDPQQLKEEAEEELFRSGYLTRGCGEGAYWEAFRERHGDVGRDLVFHLARRHSGLTLRQIGEQSGGLHYVAVSNAIRRFDQRLESDRSLQRLKKIAEAKLLNV